MWRLPIPTYDPVNETHAEIARLAGELTDMVAAQPLRGNNFVTNRRDLRVYLAAQEAGRALDSLVVELLGGEPAAAEPAPVDPQAARHVPWLVSTTAAPLDLTAGVEIDVDCEFDRDGKVYLWGVLLTRHGQDPTYRAFGSPNPDLDEVTLASEFAGWLTTQLEEAAAAGSSGRWFHYGSVEAQHLRRLLGHDADKLLAPATDLLEIIRLNFYAPGGYGLKKLGLHAGAAWRTKGAIGADTFEWVAAARGGDTAAWTRLRAYNEDDTRATRLLRGALRTLSPDSAFPHGGHLVAGPMPATRSADGTV